MRHLLILTCLLFGTPATADEADFDFKSKKANIAIEKYEATIKKAKAVEKRNRVDLILALEAALKYERTEGELDEAIKIRDAIKALKKGVRPAGASVAGSKGKTPLIVGVWKALPTGNRDVFIVRPDGTAYRGQAKLEGRWTAANNTGREFIIQWPDGINNIKLNRDNKSFEGVHPGSGYRWRMTRDSYPPRGKETKKIPADAVKWNGHHYWVSNEGTTWHLARDYCESLGGHLARIENQAEHNFIDRTLDQQIKTPIKQQKQSERDHWVDGERGADGVWRFSDGTKFSYFNWDGNPVIPFVDTNHRWLALGFPESNHGWINMPSDYKLGFICEWDE